MGLFSSQIPTKKMVVLCRQLATAYEGGIPVVQTLELVRNQFDDRNVRHVLEAMSLEVRQGNSLGEAAWAQRKYLPPFFVQLLTTGEQSGKLDIMLRDLAEYYEDRLEMRRRLAHMMTYPALQLIAAWFLGTFALQAIGAVTAGFTDRGANTSLESIFMRYVNFQIKALIVAGLLFVGMVILARMGIFKWLWSGVTTHLWPFAPVSRRFALARFFRSMSLLLGSGLDIVNCIKSSAAVMVNPYIEQDMLKAVPHVKEGATLAQAFSGSRYLPPMAREMLYVGEQSGELENQLRKVSEYFLGEATHAANIATKVLGVAVLLIVACLIGYIIISFYMTYLGGIMDAVGI